MNRKISIMENKQNKFLVYEVERNKKNNLSLNHAIKNGQHHLVETFIEEKNNVTALYNITELVPIMETIPKYPGRDDIFGILKRIIYVVEELREEFLCEPDLLLIKEHIYYDTKEHLVKFIAVPEVLDENNSIVNVVKDIIATTNWKHNEDRSYLDELNRVLKKNDTTFDEIVDVINQELKKPIQYISVDKQSDDYIVRDISEDVINNKMHEAPKPPAPPKPPVVLGPVASSPPYEHEEYGETSVLSGEGVGETTVLSAPGETTVLNQSQPQVKGTLVRQKNNERVLINSNEFWIGKDPMNVNYCIFDNTAISRKHAKIVSRNNEFFIIDNHSTNHVYVNGVMIEPDREVKLISDTNVRLSDEDFRFSIG